MRLAAWHQVFFCFLHGGRWICLHLPLVLNGFEHVRDIHRTLPGKPSHDCRLGEWGEWHEKRSGYLKPKPKSPWTKRPLGHSAFAPSARVASTTWHGQATNITPATWHGTGLLCPRTLKAAGAVCFSNRMIRHIEVSGDRGMWDLPFFLTCVGNIGHF